ncbi:MAG: hypothetical protein WCB85_15020 [Candidatus Dormiibacterota bacterium]
MTDIESTRPIDYALVPKSDLTRAQAFALTEKIRTATVEVWRLLAEAYRTKAHGALGYKTWDAYVQHEFDMSRTHAYRLLTQAWVTEALEEAAGVELPAGTVSARQAAELKPHLGEVTDTVMEATAGKRKDARPEIVEAVVEAALPCRARATNESESPGEDSALAKVSAPAPHTERLTVEVSTGIAVAARQVASNLNLSLSDWHRTIFEAAAEGLLAPAAAPDPKAVAKVVPDGKAAETRARSQRTTREAPADCKHPVNQRIGDTCMVCGRTVKG